MNLVERYLLNKKEKYKVLIEKNCSKCMKSLGDDIQLFEIENSFYCITQKTGEIPVIYRLEDFCIQLEPDSYEYKKVMTEGVDILDSVKVMNKLAERY